MADGFCKEGNSAVVSVVVNPITRVFPTTGRVVGVPWACPGHALNTKAHAQTVAAAPLWQMGFALPLALPPDGLMLSLSVVVNPTVRVFETTGRIFSVGSVSTQSVPPGGRLHNRTPDCDARDGGGPHALWHACGEGKGPGGSPKSKNPPHTSVLVRGVGQRHRAP